MENKVFEFEFSLSLSTHTHTLSLRMITPLPTLTLQRERERERERERHTHTHTHTHTHIHTHTQKERQRQTDRQTERGWGQTDRCQAVVDYLDIAAPATGTSQQVLQLPHTETHALYPEPSTADQSASHARSQSAPSAIHTDTRQHIQSASPMPVKQRPTMTYMCCTKCRLQ